MDMNIINTTLWSAQLQNHMRIYVTMFASGVVVMFKTMKLRMQITGWNAGIQPTKAHWSVTHYAK